MSFLAGSIHSTLGLDMSGFEGGMLRSHAVAHLFPAVVSEFLANPLLGLIGLAEEVGEAIKEGIEKAFETVEEMAAKFHAVGIAAERAGVSADFLSKIGAAAKEAGSGVEGVGDAMKFLNNHAADAASGNKEAVEMFADIGVSVTDAGGKLRSTEAIFDDVANSISRMEDPAKKTQAAMNLMGRGGTELIPLMKNGAEGMREAGEEMTMFSHGISETEAKLGGNFMKLMGQVEDALEGVAKAFVMPALEWFDEHSNEIMDVMQELFPIVQEAGQALGGVFAGGLRLALDVAQALAPVLEFIAGVMEHMSSYGAIGAINPIVSLGVAAFQTANDGPRSRGGGGGAGGGGGNVNVGGIHVSLAPDATAAAIANKIQPHLQAAGDRHVKAVADKTEMEAVRSGL